MSQGLGSDSHWGLGGLLGDKQLGPKEDPTRGGLEGLDDDRTNIYVPHGEARGQSGHHVG